MVQAMNIQLHKAGNRDRDHELMQFFVQLLLLRAPVEAIAPVCGQSFDFVQRDSHVPGCGVQFIGEASVLEFLI